MVVYERIKKHMEFMAFHQGGKETLASFKVDYMEKIATLTAAGVEAPRPAEYSQQCGFQRGERARGGDQEKENSTPSGAG